MVIKNILGFSLICLIFLAGMLLLGKDSLDSYNTQTHTVQRGETVWDIVDSLDNTNEYDNRRLMSWVSDVNDLEDYAIHPGMELVVPDLD